MNPNDLDPAWLQSQLTGAQWHTASSGGQSCVEVAFLARGIVALRDSKNLDKPAHIFDDAEYDTFIAGIMRGELRRPRPSCPTEYRPGNVRLRPSTT